MSLLLIMSLVYSVIGLNLEFNSNQFPNWIKATSTYSSFMASSDAIEWRFEDVLESNCVFFTPKIDEHLNESASYIFESKCYTDSHCSTEMYRENNKSSVLDAYSCPHINGTIDKVGIFSIAEFSYSAQVIYYFVYIIIEGCSVFKNTAAQNFIWIMTNDTKYKPTVIKNYLLKLPLNDNKLFFGEVTFDDGDRNCSNLCKQIICDKSLELKIEREQEQEPGIQSTTFKTNLAVLAIKDEELKSSTGLLIYLPIVIGSILIIAILSYLVYHTLF